MGDWQYSTIYVGWAKEAGDRRFYWVLIGAPYGWLPVGTPTSFKAVVDDFGTLVSVKA